MATYFKRAARGASYFFIGYSIASLLAYFIRIVLAKNLSVHEFGLFYAVFNFILFFLFFRNLGLDVALSKFIPEFLVKKEEGRIKSAILSTISIQLLVSLLFVAAVWVFSGFLSASYFKDPAAFLLLRIISAYFLTSIAFTFISSFFKGFQKTNKLAIVEPMKNAIVLGLIIAFLSLNLGIYAPVYAYLAVGPLLFFIFLQPLLKTFNIFKIKDERFSDVSKKLLIFGLPLIVMSIGGKFITYFDTLMLTYFSTLELVGIYNVILPTALVFMIISISIGSIFMPMISELWARRDKKRIELGINLIYKYIFLLSIPVIMTFFAFSKLVIKIIFGNEYILGSLALKILLVGVIFNLLVVVNQRFLIGIGKPKTVTKIVVVAAIINILLNLILIPLFNIYGAAVATTASYLTMLVISISDSKRFVKIKVPLKEWVAIFTMGFVFVGIISLVKWLLNIDIFAEALLSLLCAGIIYFEVLYILKIFDIKEFISYIKKVR